MKFSRIMMLGDLPDGRGGIWWGRCYWRLCLEPRPTPLAISKWVSTRINKSWNEQTCSDTIKQVLKRKSVSEQLNKTQNKQLPKWTHKSRHKWTSFEKMKHALIWLNKFWRDQKSSDTIKRVLRWSSLGSKQDLTRLDNFGKIKEVLKWTSEAR